MPPSDLLHGRTVEAVGGGWHGRGDGRHHIWGPVSERTRSELRTILFDYIEVFYNRSRHQAGLDDRTPAEAYAARRAA